MAEEKIDHSSSPEVQYPTDSKVDPEINGITHIETEDGFRKEQYVFSVGKYWQSY